MNSKLIDRTIETVLAATTSIVSEGLSIYNELKQSGWEKIGAKANTIPIGKRKSVAYKARAFAKGTPLVAAIVKTYQLLVHARGFQINASDEEINTVINAYIKLNPSIFGQTSKNKQESLLWTDSLVFFLNQPFELQGIERSIGMVKSSFINNSQEIVNIVSNPEDETDHWLYERTFDFENLDQQIGVRSSLSQSLVIYPDINFTPTEEFQAFIEAEYAKTRKAKSIVFKWDTKVYAIILNDGLSRLFPVLSWVECYERLLNMIATVYSAISAIALVVKAKAEHVDAIGDEIQQIQGAKDNHGAVGNIGQHFVVDSSGISTLNAKQALLDDSQMNLFLWHITMVTCLPPDAFGRPEPTTGLSTGANAKQLMRLAVEAERMFYKDAYTAMINYMLIQEVKVGSLQNLGTVVSGVTTDNTRIIEFIVWNDNVDGSFEVVFPQFTLESIKDLVQAVIMAHTLDGKTPNQDISTPREYYTDVMSLFNKKDLSERLRRTVDEWTIDVENTTTTIDNGVSEALNNLRLAVDQVHNIEALAESFIIDKYQKGERLTVDIKKGIAEWEFLQG